MASDVSQALRRLRKAGYQVYLCRGGHWQVMRGSRVVTTIAATPGNRRRLLANVKTNVRKWERNQR